MTNRRSLQTSDARLSRQTQFVPGHVGGRVASAQPVLRRRTIGATQAITGTPPLTVTAGAARDVHGTTPDYTVTVPSIAGYSAAVVLVIGYGYTGLSIPAGWDTLASGSFGTNGTNGGRISDYHLLVQPSPPSTGGSVTFTYASQEYSLLTTGNAYAYAYFSGSVGGTWAAVTGPTYNSVSTAGFADVGSAQAWFQCGAVSAIYTNGSVPAGVQLIGNAGGAYAYPGVSSDGAVSGITPKGAAEIIDYNTIGAAGTPNSVALAAIWTP